MRICYFNYEWDLDASTGASTQIVQTTAGLGQLGHEVVVLNRHRKPRGVAAGGPRSRWSWEGANLWRSLRGIPAETEILRRHRADAALTLHALRFSSIAAARRLGIPVVLQVNAPVPHEIRAYRPDFQLLPGVAEWMERRMLSAADGVVVVSGVLKDYFVRCGVRPEQITVVPNGADPEQFRPEAADPAFRACFPDRVLIGFVGSFARFHGLDLLEAAIPEVIARHPAAHFVLIGGGPGAERLRRRCREGDCGDRVTFLGYVPFARAPCLMAAMDILVAPYPAQDFFYFSPIKLFEYMTCGRAVVAARLGQIAEVIRDGHNGLLYDPGSPKEFLDKLLRLVEDPGLRAALGAEARRTIQAGYTWSHNARLMNEALEGARRRREAKTPLARPVRSPGF